MPRKPVIVQSCPHCGSGKTRVAESQTDATGTHSYIVRTRRCLGCGRAFDTYEVAADLVETMLEITGYGQYCR